MGAKWCWYKAVEHPGGGGGVSSFQVTGVIEGFFWVSNFRFQDFLGVRKLGKYFLGVT